MATLNGAKALGIADTTGSIAVGKRADIILIRGNDINIAPVADIEASVVQSATPANVDTVLVDGRIVKRGGKLVAYDVRQDRARRQGFGAAHPRRRGRAAGAKALTTGGRMMTGACGSNRTNRRPARRFQNPCPHKQS